MIEFEVKAPVPPHLEAGLRRRLGEPDSTEEHADSYFQHPARDFAATDEAARLGRRGARVELTYKGPRLDATTKSRREIVVPVGDESAMSAWLDAMGFVRAFEVRKHRESFHVAGFDVALDSVPGLGVFVEVERLLAEDEDRSETEREADAMLTAWGLEARERRSYFELLQPRVVPT